MKAKKITLCGSTRFMSEYMEANQRLSRQGHLVYSVSIVTTEQSASGGVLGDEKLRLDALHMVKILESDEIFVVNPGGYVGESTKREIHFAELIGKPVKYLVPPYSVTK